MKIRDGNFELLEWDAVTGRTVWGYFDGEKTVFRTDYPVENMIKNNKAEFNSAPDHWRGDYVKVASVPLNVLYDSGLDEAIGQKDNRFISRFLNDSDNRAWRTRDGRV